MTLENYILLVVVAIINLITFFLLMKDPELRTLGEDQKPLVSKHLLVIYGGVFLLVNLAIAVMFIYVYPTNSLLFSLKRFGVLALLWPLALIDWKTYRIPNRFVLAGLIFRVVLIVAELFLDKEYLAGNLVSEVVAAVALGMACALCCICIKNSIGFGDIKLFLVMGMLLGLKGIWSAILMSLVVAFFMAIFLLITKKKSKKDVVPFAPAIAIGTYLSIILTGM